MSNVPDAKAEQNGQRLQRLVEVCTRTLWLPDLSLLYLILGTVVANLLGGPPTWVLIVAAPSSGKSMLLDALFDLRYVFGTSSVSEAGFLSGHVSRDGSRSPGLLREMGDFGIMVFSDFGTLLSEHSGTRGRIFAILREIYDGAVIRRLSKVQAWFGHAGCLAASTEAIDTPMVDLGALGERFIIFRPKPMSPEDEILTCLETDRQADRFVENREARRRAFVDYFDAVEIPETKPLPTEAESERLITLATICTRARSATTRDGYSRELEGVPEAEKAPRVYQQLRQLYAGLTVVGVPEADKWSILVQTALSGIHPGRLACMRYLLGSDTPHKAETIAAHLRLSTRATFRHLEDLAAHGVLDRSGVNPILWAPSPWFRSVWWATTGTWDQRGQA